MPNLRRSIQSKNTGGLSPTRAHAAAHGVAPPRKVIKALYDYNSVQPEELSFAKGDFFHVVGNEDDVDWFEACNPITGARGYVPVTYFQLLEKAGSQQYQNQSQQPGRQRNSNHSFDDIGHDSGTFTDPLPQQYYSQQQLQQQQQFQQKQQQQPYIQHGHSLSNGSNGMGYPAGGAAGAFSPSNSSPAISQRSTSSGSASLPKCQPLYGIVLYDFEAERADELDCKVGDAILVIAQSNDEWYVGKPIGRLGGPGLIPVSFVEIRDTVTGKPINVPEMLRQTGTVLPRVDEWKKQALDYKANSIPLGRIDANDAPQPQQPQQQPTLKSLPLHFQPQSPQAMPFNTQPLTYQHVQQQQQQPVGGPSIQQLKNKLSRGDLKSPNMRDPSSRRNPSQDLDIGRRMDGANARTMPPSRSYSNDSYDDGSRHYHGHQNNAHNNNNNNGNHHNGNGHSNGSSGSSRIVFASVESFHHEDEQYWFSVRVELASGAIRNLFRLYEDFYNFHIALLEEFPEESGRVGDHPRILPFMPIPLQDVNDTVSASRRKDLDAYVQDLCKLPNRVMQHPLVEHLFAVKDGDMETPPASGNGRSTSPGPGRSSRAPTSAGNGNGTPQRAGFGHRSQSSLGARSYGDDSPSPGATSPPLRSLPQYLPSSSGNGGGNRGSDEMIKIKISHKDDIMAMRIPASIPYKTLYQKIFDRLQVDGNKMLSYRDDRGEVFIRNDDHVREAIDRSGGKLMIYVGP
ncbi:bud emergence protein 1 [Dissophora globulifera]|uniref:Bud emergence protein 1 n=1 Tax=Dissophora globulifera TaxID=979702 RepID=A0A9P6UQL9_9FUNG|nr:bud emergence protein 1 [Dissophora globulifera]